MEVKSSCPEYFLTLQFCSKNPLMTSQLYQTLKIKALSYCLAVSRRKARTIAAASFLPRAGCQFVVVLTVRELRLCVSLTGRHIKGVWAPLSSYHSPGLANQCKLGRTISPGQGFLLEHLEKGIFYKKQLQI